MAIDWSEGRWREMLVGHRKFMWREDTLALLAAWLDLRPGLTLVDAGCGLGYLGYTFWPWFGRGGRYVGVDENGKLLADAVGIAGEWAEGGDASFVRGSAYELPVADDTADRTLCQTLLMHLAEPERAVSELVRVTRPGGRVVCMEPDNIAGTFVQSLHANANLSLDDRIFLLRSNLQWHEGHRRLGRGDQSVGSRLNFLLHEAGLEDIDVRLCDRVQHMEPPYEGDRQQWIVGLLMKATGPDRDDSGKEAAREAVLAGGGTAEEFDRTVELVERQAARKRERLERGEYYQSYGGPFFVAVGRKAAG